VARLRAVFPEAGVDQLERLHRLLDEMLEQRRECRILPDDARIGEDRLEAQHHLAVDVVLRCTYAALPMRTGPTPS
jgi:hypothetical protein